MERLFLAAPQDQLEALGMGAEEEEVLIYRSKFFTLVLLEMVLLLDKAEVHTILIILQAGLAEEQQPLGKVAIQQPQPKGLLEEEEGVIWGVAAAEVVAGGALSFL